MVAPEGCRHPQSLDPVLHGLSTELQLQRNVDNQRQHNTSQHCCLAYKLEENDAHRCGDLEACICAVTVSRNGTLLWSPGIVGCWEGL